MKKGITIEDVKKLGVFEVDALSHTTLKLQESGKGYGYDLLVKQMYEYVPFNLEVLMKLADLFGTKNIDTDLYHTNGCETCDFGSSYEVTFIIRPEKEVK